MEETHANLNCDSSTILEEFAAQIVTNKGNNTTDSLNERQLKEKVVNLLMINVQRFQQAIIINRRRNRQSYRRRQILLRNFYMKQMMELQKHYTDLFTILARKYYNNDNIERRLELEIAQLATKATENNVIYANPFKDFFLELKISLNTEEQWLNNFRMTRHHFDRLCEQLGPSLRAAEVNVPLERRVPPDIRIALALYVVSQGECNLQNIAKLFRVHSSAAVIRYLKQFASALLSRQGHLLLTLPKCQKDYDEIRHNFHQLTNMPPVVVGVMGVCTMPVVHENVENNTEIRLEAYIDDRLLFRKLQISSKPMPALFSDMNHEIIGLNHIKINQRLLPCFILAPIHQNYPLRPWLLQRYLDPIAPHEYDFNEAADNLHDISDRAFQRLFARFKFLAKPFNLKVDTSALIITACCALHNLLEEVGEAFLQEWEDAVDISNFLQGKYTPKQDTCRSAEDALDIRDFLARTISSTEL